MDEIWEPAAPIETRRHPSVNAPLAPLLAGARARGVADGLEWLGLAAVLLDDRGEVLHVNPGAIELMGDHLYLESGRLKAHRLDADLALREAIRGALVEGLAGDVSVPGDSFDLGVRVAAMTTGDDDPFQLLRAVVLLTRATPPRSSYS